MKDYTSNYDGAAVGRRLKRVREVSRMNQLSFSQCIGISVRTLQNYEQAARPPSAEFMCALIRKFEVDITWLLTGKGEMHPLKNEEHTLIELCSLLEQLSSGQQQAVLEFVRLFQREK